MTRDPLVVFLYVLMRDRLPFGQIEEIMAWHVEKLRDKEAVFSAPEIEQYATTLAARLRPEVTEPEK